MYPPKLLYMWIQNKAGGEKIPRTGRPTDDPKKLSTRIRLSEEDIKKLEYCHEVLGLTKAEVIRQGIDIMYKKAQSKK